jgi:hypothetical protein
VKGDNGNPSKGVSRRLSGGVEPGVRLSRARPRCFLLLFLFFFCLLSCKSTPEDGDRNDCSARGREQVVVVVAMASLRVLEPTTCLRLVQVGRRSDWARSHNVLRECANGTKECTGGSKAAAAAVGWLVGSYYYCWVSRVECLAGQHGR